MYSRCGKRLLRHINQSFFQPTFATCVCDGLGLYWAQWRQEPGHISKVTLRKIRGGTWNSVELIYSDSAMPYIFKKDYSGCHTANYTKILLFPIRNPQTLSHKESIIPRMYNLWNFLLSSFPTTCPFQI